MDLPNIVEFTRGLRATLMIGAMRSDATPEQVTDMVQIANKTNQKFLRGDITWDDWIGGFRKVMGPDWEPSGEWAAQLEALEDGPTVPDSKHRSTG